MKALIKGDALNVVTYINDKLDVISIQPTFRVEVEDVRELDDRNASLSNRFMSQFGYSVVITDLEDKLAVNTTHIEMIKNDMGVDCILCSIAAAFEYMCPCIIDYVPYLDTKRGIEFGATSRYKAVVYDTFGNAHGLCGLSRDGGTRVFVSDFINGQVPVLEVGQRPIRFNNYNLKPIQYVIGEFGLVSNLDTWYTI